MALTIRLDKKDTKALDKLKDHYGVGSYSKALLKAAHELPGLDAELEQTKFELDRSNRQFNHLVYLLQQRDETNKDIHEVVYSEDEK